MVRRLLHDKWGRTPIQDLAKLAIGWLDENAGGSDLNESRF